MDRKTVNLWHKYIEKFYAFLIHKICQKVCGQKDISSQDSEDDSPQDSPIKVVIRAKKIYDDSFAAIFKRLALSLVCAFCALLVITMIYCYLDTESIKEVLSLIIIPLLVGLLSSAFATLIFIRKDTKDKNLLYCSVRQKVLLSIFSSIYVLFSEIAACVVADQLNLSTDDKNRNDIFYQKHTTKEWTSIFAKIQENRSKACGERIDNGDAAKARECAERLTSIIKYILSQIERYGNKEEFFNLHQLISKEESSILNKIKTDLYIILRYSNSAKYQSEYLKKFAADVESGLEYFEDFKALGDVSFGQHGIYMIIADEENTQ